VHQAILPSTYIPLTEVDTPILTTVPPQYFPGCFPLFFLEGHYSFLSSEVTFLHLDSMAWKPSVFYKGGIFSQNLILELF